MSSRSEFTYLSTFAGCGGSSLGYKWAGGHGVAAVEFDANAAETYRLNFPHTPVLQRDIATVTVDELLALTGLQVGELDILDGSPPCQGFSTAGKREFSDPRNSLFKEYVRLIEGLQPKVFVMENVSGMVKGKMKLIFREIMLALKATGYTVRCKLLNAMYYEVPQSRERLIWIGVRGDLGNEPGFPEPVGKPSGPDKLDSRPTKYSDRRYGDKIAINGQPVPTIAKMSRMFWSRDEEFGPLSYAAAASFPREYRWLGTLKDVKNRIGNSVPPRFMYHIAAHIRDHVLPAPGGA